MAPRDVGASRSSQCDWRDSRSPPSPFARIAIPSTLSLSPPSTLSLTSLGHPSPHPSACVLPSLSLFRSISDSTSIYISSFLSYRIFCLYLSHPLRHVPSILLHPLRFLFLFLSFALFHPHSPFLLGRSIYPYFFLSVAPFLLALSRASPSVPQQPSRHWPSWSREHQLDQSYAR